MWSIYLTRWVDRCITGDRFYSMLLMVFCAGPFLLALALRNHSPLDVEPAASILMLVAGGLGSAALTLWVASRAWRKMQRWARTADRQYDEKDKFLLPSEYRDTESASAARRRKELSNG